MLNVNTINQVKYSDSRILYLQWKVMAQTIRIMKVIYGSIYFLLMVEKSKTLWVQNLQKRIVFYSKQVANSWSANRRKLMEFFMFIWDKLSWDGAKTWSSGLMIIFSSLQMWQWFQTGSDGTALETIRKTFGLWWRAIQLLLLRT